MRIPKMGTQRLRAVKETTSTFSSGWRKTSVLLLSSIFCLGVATSAMADVQSWESEHTFSMNDVIGGFDASTYGNTGSTQDTSIICTAAPCPGDAQPYTYTTSNSAPIPGVRIDLFPIDSEFGPHVVDFVGAQQKVRDNDYGEGWAGNLPDGEGIAVSNAVTERYKVKAPQGTWCQGLGGNSVKCSTEHYTTMEHVLSCHEVIPYFYADPVSGTQGIQETPDGSLSVDCATTALDDEQMILVGGVETSQMTDSTPGVQMDANDKTSVLDDVSVSDDYSITLKDDGKALYRWGALVKFPNDVRMYARLALPELWKTRDLGGALMYDFAVTKAYLIVNHTITNNPNDQLRPEDLENEAAIGVLPDHTVEDGGTPLDPTDDIWKSTKLCYEGDGDLIDNELGTGDPDVLGIGTYLKNGPFALDPAAMPGVLPEDDPYVFSADLLNALTNAWYTTIDREPFEWSYVVETDLGGGETEVNYFGCPGPLDPPLLPPVGWEDYAALCTNVQAGATLFSGPRWRLKPNKFGQDLPGLEIPLTAATEGPCTPPPFTSDLIKYNVGTPTTTVINLLDWDEEANGPSPLSSSQGWVDSLAANPFIEIVDTVTDDNLEERQITSIGAPMSEDFDLTVYVKGDRKPVFIYDARLVLEYEDGGVVPPADVSAVSLVAPASVNESDPITVSFTVNNPEAADVLADISICGVIDGLEECAETLGATLVQGETTFDGNFTAGAPETTINWVGTVTAVDDPNAANNVATASTTVNALAVDLDMRLASLTGVPTRVFGTNRTLTMVATACNLDAVANASGIVTLVGNDSLGAPPVTFAPQAFTDLAAGTCTDATFVWTAPYTTMRVAFTAEVILTSGVDTNPNNDWVTSVRVVVFPR